MEPIIASGGNIIDHHSPSFFPKRFFDLIVVLTTNNTILYDRLVARGYAKEKIDENIECEIMRVVELDAWDSYDHEKVVVLKSESANELEGNVERIVEWASNWIVIYKVVFYLTSF